MRYKQKLKTRKIIRKKTSRKNPSASLEQDLGMDLSEITNKDDDEIILDEPQRWYLIWYADTVLIGTLYQTYPGVGDQILFWFKNIYKYLPQIQKFELIPYYSIMGVLDENKKGPFKQSVAKTLVKAWYKNKMRQIEKTPEPEVLPKSIPVIRKKSK